MDGIVAAAVAVLCADTFSYIIQFKLNYFFTYTQYIVYVCI